MINKIKSPYVDNEHFVPNLGIDLEPYIKSRNVTAAHHLIRYYWAREVVKSLPDAHLVLDIACGSGYGTYIMALSSPTKFFLGADYDKKAVSQANINYSLSNLSYKFGDISQWTNTIGENKFDVIISFDTLEHLPHREIMMENIIRHLSVGGLLLLSTPCGLDENNLTPNWPSHKIEYSLSSLYDFLRRYFEIIVRPDGNNFPCMDVLIELDKEGIVYDHRLNPVICKRPISFENPYG
ncbi:MAG: class I SAM-dependent methyltransferase [Anaerolineaceae bacterium]|nr:class I SAM-dependent methyltransferase [Anaerolineaceae bacterium]